MITNKSVSCEYAGWKTTFLLMMFISIFMTGSILTAQTKLDRSQTGLSLEQVLNLALENNHKLKSSEASVRAASKGLSVAKSMRWPMVKFSTFYEGFPLEPKLLIPRHMDIPTAEQVMPMPQGMLDFFNRQFHRNIFNISVSASWQLFTGGKISGLVNLTRSATELAQENLQFTKDELIFNVSKTYYKILQLQKVVEAQQKSVETLQESYRRVEQFVEQGKATQLDLYRLEARLANVEQSLIQSRGMLQKTYVLLNTLLGSEDVSQPLSLSDSLRVAPLEIDRETATAEALQNNPEFLALRHAVEMQEQKVRIARSVLFPNLTANAMYKLATTTSEEQLFDKEFGDFRDDASILVTLSFPIFEPQSWNKIGQEKALLQQKQEALQQLRLKVMQQVESTYLDVQESLKRIEAARKSLQAGRESLRIEQLKLQTGKGLVNDVLDAQADQLKAEVFYLQALADYNIAVVALKKAMGRIRK